MWADFFFFEYRMVVNKMPPKSQTLFGGIFLEKIDLKCIYGFSDGDQLGH